MTSTLQDRILEAATRIKGYVRHTPLDHSHWLSTEGKANVYIKWENEQVTGSFKARGAFNKIITLINTNQSVKSKGVVTASSGNHGAACSLAMKSLGINNGVVYSPEYVSDAKRSMIDQYGGQVKLHGQDCIDTENYARTTAQERDMPYIPPYNDYDVIAGQGTVGLEIHEDLPSVDVVFVAVGGGGLISGIATYFKAVKPDVKVIGCQPVESAVLYHSVKACKILDLSSGDTLSDGTAGGVEQGSVTLDLCKSLVDDWVLVTEQNIGKAVYDVLDKHHKIVEGATGVTIAAYLKTKDQYEGKTVAIVSCGGNISIKTIKSIISLHG
ncbi:uncharacterized protein LOC116295871 [Actinia tenebrosa]|uniref:L-serine ammonia-lyase n=1 Tax=Actinia tenebrosa TaxID=6105 RepID=A0A6P8I438_ACTTE|nr:uncharacterized protein LOC116295871 [Actinia tenebrosa]